MQHSYPTTVLPAPVTDNVMAELISEVVIPFTRRQLADASNRTAEAAKKWKGGDSAPSLASAINLGRDIPEIKWLIYTLLEVGDLTFDSTEVQTKVRQTLLRVASGNDATALIARQALQQMHRPQKPDPEASASSTSLDGARAAASSAGEPAGDARNRASGSFPSEPDR